MHFITHGAGPKRKGQAGWKSCSAPDRIASLDSTCCLCHSYSCEGMCEGGSRRQAYIAPELVLQCVQSAFGLGCVDTGHQGAYWGPSRLLLGAATVHEAAHTETLSLPFCPFWSLVSFTSIPLAPQSSFLADAFTVCSLWGLLGAALCCHEPAQLPF